MQSLIEIAEAVRAGQRSAREAVERCWTELVGGSEDPK